MNESTSRLPEKPKPSGLLIATSLVVILCCLFLTSFFLAAYYGPDFGYAILGTFFLPLPIYLAIRQYQATFRGRPIAAKRTATVLFVFSGLMVITLANMIGPILWETFEFDWQLYDDPTLTLLPISLGAFAAGRINRRWFQQLRSCPEENSASRYSLRELFGLVAAVAIVAAFTGWIIRTTPPKYAEHVEQADAPFGLPLEATDISFCQGLRGAIAYEFTIDERGFRCWVNAGIGSLESRSANVPILPITEPQTILRYIALSNELDGESRIVITHGLQYTWSYSDRSVKAVFDSNSSRAYYSAHYH